LLLKPHAATELFTLFFNRNWRQVNEQSALLLKQNISNTQQSFVLDASLQTGPIQSLNCNNLFYIYLNKSVDTKRGKFHELG
jgi:hypothetical protein